MHSSDEARAGRQQNTKQRFFIARELQLSIALLAVMALLGGMFLQAVVTAVAARLGYSAPVLILFLVAGYIGLVAVLSLFFTSRLVGPFKRLEYEMKLIRSGDLSRRLSVRAKDDLHIVNFTRYANDVIARLDETSRKYADFNSAAHGRIKEIVAELSRDHMDCDNIKRKLAELDEELERIQKGDA